MRSAFASRAGSGCAACARREHGGAYVALLGLLLVGSLGLAFHSVFLTTATERLQRAADAAALAAVRHVEADAARWPVPDFALTRLVAADAARHDEADQASVELNLNPGNDPDGDIVVGFWNDASATFTPECEHPNAVRVRARLSSASFGGPLEFVSGPMLGALLPGFGATGTAKLGVEDQPSVLVLEPDSASSLRLTGGATLLVSTGKLQVNSSDSCAIKLSGTPLLSAQRVSTRGGICAAAGLVDGELDVGEPVIPDPLADQLPDDASWEAIKSTLALPLGKHGCIGASGSFAPGYYPGGVSLSGQVTALLQPGIYLLGGDGISLRGGANLAGAQVLLLIDRGGQVDVRGEGFLRLTPPDPGPGFLRGVALMSHRANTGLAVSLAGTGEVHIQATVYVPSGVFRMAGGPHQAIETLITDRLESVGGASLRVYGHPQDEGGPQPELVD